MSTSPDPVDLLGSAHHHFQLTLDAKFRFCPLPLFSIKIDIEYSLLPEPGTLLKVSVLVLPVILILKLLPELQSTPILPL